MKLDDATQAAAGTTSSAAGGLGSRTADVQAWQREMERAQAKAWFHGFAGGDPAAEHPGTKASSADKPLSPAQDERHSHQSAASGRAAHHPVRTRREHALPANNATAGAIVTSHAVPAAYRSASTAIGAPVGEPKAAEVPRMQGPRNLSAAPTAVAIPGGLAEEDTLQVTLASTDPPPQEAATADEIADLAPAARRAQPHSTHLPVRIHVEGDKAQATVWLGLDMHAASHLPAVSRAVAQWLAQSGYGQVRWICNGRPLDLDALPAPGDHEAAGPADPFHSIIDQPLGESA